MAGPDLTELLQSAAPTPTTTLDIGVIEHRANRRRRRRQGAFAATSLLVVGSLVGLSGVLSTRPEGHTVVAGPPSSKTIPLHVGAATTTMDVRLLDATRLRVSLPNAVGAAFSGVTFGALELHGSVYAARGSERGWGIDVTLGSIDSLVPGGELLPVPASSTASSATVDRRGSRLGLQFGPWAVVAAGDRLTEADVDALLGGIALADTPDGFVEYRGSLPLWVADRPDASLSGRAVALSAFVRQCSARAAQPTATGLMVERVIRPDGAVTILCDSRNRLEIWLIGDAPLSEEEVDLVDVEVLSVGSTLAAVQSGQRP